MIVAWASVRGSPGATSWALLAAAAWPAAVDPERAVVEADLDGGVLGARYGLGVDPGVVSLIAALRRSDGRSVPVEEHGRPVGPGLWLVPGPESGEQARSVWAETAAAVAERLAVDDRVWLVDAGRVYGRSVTVPLVQHARLTVLVCRSGPEDLVQVPARVATLAGYCESVGVLVVGKVPYTAAELGEFFGTTPVWRAGAADDIAGIAGAVLSPGRARRSWVWRTALDVAGAIASHVHDHGSPPAESLNGDRARSEVGR
jgi:MinD-like ATPase involved in chromosome partitioning or flagellar assembly